MSATRRRLDFEPLEHRTLLTTIPVTTTNDTFLPADGLTSLREAILLANATPGVDEIQLPAGNFRLRLTDFLADDDAATGVATVDIGAAGVPDFRQGRLFDLASRTLGIFGSDLDDNLILQADGIGNILLTSNGQIVVPLGPNGQPLQPGLGPTVKNTSHITAWLGPGHDFMSVDGQSGWLNAIRLEILMQAGNDAAFVQAESQSDQAQLRLRVSGGSGADLIAAQLNLQGSRFFRGEIGLEGGLDHIVLFDLAQVAQPQPNPLLLVLDVTATLTGGTGPDLVAAQVQFGPAAGVLRVLVEGNEGSDLLLLLPQIAGGPLQPQLRINGGGAGFDVAAITTNVAVVGVERVIVVGQNSPSQSPSSAAGPSASSARAGFCWRSALQLQEVDLAIAELINWLNDFGLQEFAAAIRKRGSNSG